MLVIIFFPLEIFAEAIQGLVSTLDGPELDRSVAFRHRPEETPHRELGLAPLLGEGHCHVKLVRIVLLVRSVVID
jgi:hypothetical protein